MRKIIASVAALATILSSLAFAPAVALADSVSANFESPPYIVGNINGQDGWSKTGPYDVAVVANTYSIPSFGAQSLRLSDAVTTGGFGDQTFSKSLADEAGETDALNGSMSGGTRQAHFEAQFDLASTMSGEQSGMHFSVSPDRGDGARMSYLRFEDAAAGINVFFSDVQGTTNPANFVETPILSGLSRSVPHSVKFYMDFYDGPSNDVVRIYVDGVLVHTGTSWENYYRFDSESNPTLVSNSRTVDSLLFRESGTAHPANANNGYLVDNVSLFSGPITAQVCTSLTLISSTTTQFKHLTLNDPAGSSADSSFSLGTPGPAVAVGPDGFPGAWNTAINDPDVAGAIFVSNTATAPSPAGSGDGQDGTKDTWRLFSKSFNVPAGAIVSSSMLHLSADNSVQAFLDNSSVGTSPNFTTVTDLPLTITPGAHELEFVVKNDAYEGDTNPTGVIYRADVNYCVPNIPPVNNCPAAPSIAAAYLKDVLHIKPGSAQYTNVISAVARNMGPQTFFNGTGSCHPSYTNIVQAYVDAHKNDSK